MKKDNLQKSVVVGIFILLALLLFNLFNVFSLKPQLEGKLIEIKELSKPANLELTVIKTTNCIDCFEIKTIIEKIKTAGVNVTKEVSLDTALPEDSKTIKELIDKYAIKKLPTIILGGEINKTSIQNFKEKNNALIFEGVTPPYVDTKTMEIIGKVNVVIITDANCDVCNDFSAAIQSLQQNGVVFSDIEYLDYKDEQAKEFIKKFEIEKAPVLFLSEDVDVYSIGQQLSQQLEKEKGYYFIESPAPYTEINTGKIRGLVTLTMITDSSCQDCYDVTIHKQILAGFGLAIDEEKIVDIKSSEGKQLIEKYSITKVPTVILGGDIVVYEGFDNIWQQAGTIENDGVYVFRELAALGSVVYKDLSKNEVVT